VDWNDDMLYVMVYEEVTSNAMPNFFVILFTADRLPHACDNEFLIPFLKMLLMLNCSIDVAVLLSH